MAVKLCIKAERRDEFLECIANNQRGTLSAEPLALEYKYGEDETTPNTFHFYEKYKGKEGFEAHQKAPHFAVWEKFAGTDPFTSPPEIAFFEEVGPTPRGGKGKGKGRGPGYCLNVHLDIKPDRREEFLSAIKADQKGTVTDEKLALQFIIGQDTSSENAFHLFERYIGKAGFEAHCASGHFAEWQKTVDAGICVSEPVVCFYNEAKKAKPPPKLQKPKWGTVKKIGPDSGGVNVFVKVVKVDNAADGFNEVVVGDATATVTLRVQGEQLAACQAGKMVRIQNAKARIVKGFLRLEVGKWGVVKPAPEDHADIEVHTGKDISAVEYELA